MGRGRQKAKQMKVARRLKYFSPETDLEALQRELSGDSKDLDQKIGATTPDPYEYDDQYSPDQYQDDPYQDDPYADDPYADPYADTYSDEYEGGHDGNHSKKDK